MHVDMVTPQFHPVLGGMELRVREIGVHLVRSGHRVVVHTSAVTPRGESLPVNESLEGIEIRRYRPVFRGGYYTTLIRPADLEGNLLDLHGYPHLSGDLTALRSRRPLVVTPIGLLYRHAPLHAPARRLYDLTFGARTLRSASRVVLMTEAEVAPARRLGVKENALRVIGCGVSDQAFDPAPPLWGRELGAFDRYILFLGRLHRDKTPLDLVRAFASIAAEFPDTGLVFAGPDGGLAETVRRVADSVSLSERIVQTGAVSESTKLRLLSGCALLSLPSRFEALGIVLLEAWAQGKPVVVSRVGGAGVLVEQVGAGLLHAHGEVPALASSLRSVLVDPAHACALGARGRDAVWAAYRWSAITTQVEQLFLEVLGETA